jgi:DtxR family transcriptional regulator, Mn-dependent transcriptional regulator
MELRVLGSSPDSIRFWSAGDKHVLAPILAHSVSVTPLVGPPREEEPGFLSDLELGSKGRVVGFSPACRGVERRRFLDLGLVPETIVGSEMVSPTGDPTAYRVRNALIALRR